MKEIPKKLQIVTLKASLLFLFIGTNLTYSQNEKLWEFNISPKRVVDVDFYDDNSFCYTNNSENGDNSDNFTIRDLNDTTLIREINLHHHAGEFEISKTNDLILISSKNKFYYYNHNVELLDSLKVLDYVLDGEPGAAYIRGFSVDFNRDIVAIYQREYRLEEEDLHSRVLVYNYQTKELVKTIDFPEGTDLTGVKLSSNSQYLAVSKNGIPAQVKIYDGNTFEHLYDIQNPDAPNNKETNIGHITFSPNGRYIAIDLELDEVNFLTYDLGSRNVITQDNIGIGYSEFLTNDYLLIWNAGPNANVYSFPELNFIHYYPPWLGAGGTQYNYENKIFISISNTIISANIFDPNILSIEENENIITNVYPQPSTGIFNIEFTAVQPQHYGYSIYDEAGSIIVNSKPKFYQSGMNQIQVDLTNHANGIYFLEFQPSIGATFKLIKE